MRPFYEKYTLTEITSAELDSYYNHKYDDVYDETEYVRPEPVDENSKRRPDVVPRVLMKKKAVNKVVVEEFSDDEPQKVTNFQPFCENPEEVRERQARRYAAKQSKKSNRSKYLTVQTNMNNFLRIYVITKYVRKITSSFFVS